MRFSKTELRLISELGNGNKSIINLAKALKISVSQTYRIAKNLNNNNILSLEKNILVPEMKTHVSLLLNLLSKARNLSNPLSGVGIEIYSSIILPKTIKEIEKETNLHKTTIFKKINQGKKMSLVLIENKKYRINEKIWKDAKEFFIELKKYEDSIDKRIPLNSLIYHKNSKEILFSNKEDLDAEKTAFSSYEKYGIKLLLITNYYYLPKKDISKKEVFIHSLYIAEKEKEIRQILFISLFYLKYKKELSNVTHEIITNLNNIFLGENISGYPTLNEIKDRADVYNIKV